jgi:hypothetical protein
MREAPQVVGSMVPRPVYDRKIISADPRIPPPRDTPQGLIDGLQGHVRGADQALP